MCLPERDSERTGRGREKTTITGPHVTRTRREFFVLMMRFANIVYGTYFWGDLITYQNKSPVLIYAERNSCCLWFADLLTFIYILCKMCWSDFLNLQFSQVY